MIKLYDQACWLTQVKPFLLWAHHMWSKWWPTFKDFPASPGPDTTLAVLSPQMTEGRHCQVHLLDDRRLELLVQVGVAHTGSLCEPPRLCSGCSLICAADLMTQGWLREKGSLEVKNPGLYIRVTIAWWHVFQSQLWYSVAVWPWASDFTSLKLLLVNWGT